MPSMILDPSAFPLQFQDNKCKFQSNPSYQRDLLLNSAFGISHFLLFNYPLNYDSYSFMWFLYMSVGNKFNHLKLS